MSNYRAIATVSAALSDILLDAAAVVDGANVTMKRPEKVGSDALDKPAINLFLYQVMPNAAWSNFDLPTRNASGELMQRPLVAVDLDYLLSFHGSELEMEPQRLLGRAVIALHAEPFLGPQRISDAISSRSYLKDSNLSEQLERVKLDPLNFNLEELSKLWSIFFQIPYTLSVAYRASAVRIESSVEVHEAKHPRTVQVKQPGPDIEGLNPHLIGDDLTFSLGTAESEVS